MQRWLLRILTVVVLALSLPVTRAGERAPDARPAVVVILADDLGWADVGVHGCRDIPTPNIDRLAASGVRCESGYSAHPFCSPMRASLLTGRYQHRFGYERNIAYDPHNRHMGLPPGERTIASRLQKAGYATGMVGKWHLGAAQPFHPRRRGFDFFFGFLGGGHDYFEVSLARPMGEGYFTPLERNGEPAPLDGYLTTALTREAIGFIESQPRGEERRPFFLYVAYNAPHTPMQAPPEILERFASIADRKRRAYAAMVSAMDDGIGEILDCLERLELRRSTLVFFLSDNGGPERANASRNDPLRGQKGDVWEGGIRVPFVASWPGLLPSGEVYREPVISIDIACTALAAAGIDPATDERLEGVDLVPFLSGKRAGPPHDALFWRKENGAAWAVRAGSLKLLRRGGAEAVELYDLSADIGESTDLAAKRPQEVRRLRSLWEEWNGANEPPFFPSFREYHREMNERYREISGRPERDRR